MSPFDFDQLIVLGGSEVPKLWELLVRMSAAALLGAAIAFRIWRVLLPFVGRPAMAQAQAQTLIAAAGAVMVVVIGDSPARAFGLVGLGSFIRFRSGLSDPRDAAVLFVMIAIGMSCGLGLFSMAGGATLFVCLILTLFEAARKRATSPTLVTVNAVDALAARARLRTIFPSARIIEAGSNAPELGKETGKLVFGLDLKHGEDARSLSDTLTQNGVPVRRVALSRPD